MKRLFSMLLIFTICFTLLTACGKKDDASSDAAATEMPSDIFSTDAVNFIDSDGLAVYSFVRAESLNREPFDATQEFYRVYRDLTSDGKSAKNFLDADREYDEEAYEILIGNTNRPESKKALEFLKSHNSARVDDFLIGSIGKKIVVVANNDQALIKGINYFSENLISGTYESGLYHFNYTDTDSKTTVNGTEIGKFTIIRPDYNFSYMAQTGIDSLIDTLYNSHLYDVKYTYDTAEASEYEIIVGNAERDGVKTITDSDVFNITVSGSKIYLNGGSPAAIGMAVTEFTKMLASGAVTDSNSTTGSYEAAQVLYDSATNYKLKWNDEFDGTALNTSKWFQCYEGWYSSDGQNGRKSIRTNDPNYVYVSDGKYYARCGYDDEKYYGNMLLTHNTMIFKYGYVELSAILPNGGGFWTALWIDSRHIGKVEDPDDGLYFDMEIDVNECFGDARTIAANCHRHATKYGAENGAGHFSLDGKYSSDKHIYLPGDDTFNDEFHTFGVLWDDDEFTFTCDGEVYFSWNNNTTNEDLDGFHQLCYLRLSTAVGFASSSSTIVPDGDPAWSNSATMVVDYMHVYQLDDGKHKMLLGDGNGGWR